MFRKYNYIMFMVCLKDKNIILLISDIKLILFILLFIYKYDVFYSYKYNSRASRKLFALHTSTNFETNL